MFSTIKSFDPDEIREYRVIAINLNQVVSVKLGTPDEGTEYITYTPTEVKLVDGTVLKLHQGDDANKEFLTTVFGADWQQNYKAIPSFDD